MTRTFADVVDGRLTAAASGRTYGVDPSTGEAYATARLSGPEETPPPIDHVRLFADRRSDLRARADRAGDRHHLRGPVPTTPRS